MNKLTITQALEQGYTHYNVDQEEEVGTLEHLQEYGVQEYNQGKKVLLMDKDRIKFSISADTIQGLLTDYVSGQEEFAMEDDTLHEELLEADFEAIEKLVNIGFKSRYMFPTDIELILESNESK